MSIELRPLGVKCNIACQYCYQHPQRDVEEKGHSYDMEKMKQGILQQGGAFTLFGGEPLLLPMDDLEEVLSWGFAQFGKNAMQTNGTLITPEHIALFKKYKVSIGISVDGPGELNDIRWAGSLGRTRELSQRTHQAIDDLVAAGITPGMIVTLHKGNATAAKLPAMGVWMSELDHKGIRSMRLHLLEVDHHEIGASFSLSAEENLAAMVFFHELEQSLQTLRFDIFREIGQLLQGNDQSTSCVWNACDPYTTAAVNGIEGDGKRSNCGRTNKRGIDFIKALTPSFTRYIALYHTPQESGGCQGCRFFAMCKGHCPGTSLEGDWRNRTEHCEVLKALFGLEEQRLLAQGKAVLSTHKVRRSVENILVNNWMRGTNPSLSVIMKGIREKQAKLAEHE